MPYVGFVALPSCIRGPTTHARMSSHLRPWSIHLIGEKWWACPWWVGFTIATFAADATSCPALLPCPMNGYLGPIGL